MSAMQKSYCQFYKIDTQDQIPGTGHVIGYFESEGYKLAAHYFFWSTQADHDTHGTVFLFHGYFDHTGIYRHLIEFLLNAGFDIVIYDLPGHGLSTGEEAAIEDFSQYKNIVETFLNICRDRVKGPWFAVGQSTGAAILLEYLSGVFATKQTFPFRHWVLLAPLVRPCGWEKLVVLHNLLGNVLKTWKRRFAENSHDQDFLCFLRTIDPLQARAISVKWAGALKQWVAKIETSPPIKAPITIIQGPDDETVDWRYNIPYLKQMLPLAKINILSSGRHHLVNESKEIRDKVFKQLLDGLRGE